MLNRLTETTFSISLPRRVAKLSFVKITPLYKYNCILSIIFPKAFLDGHSDFVIINGRYCYYERGRLTQDNFEIEEVNDIVVSQVQLGLLVALLFRDRRPCHTLRGSTDGAMISSIVGCMHERSYQRVRSSPGCWWRTSMGG